MNGCYSFNPVRLFSFMEYSWVIMIIKIPTK
jgi:hypothetical protein